jgi:hypothetical protein
VCGTVDCQRHGRSGWVAYKAKHPARAAFYASSTWRFMREQHLKSEPLLRRLRRAGQPRRPCPRDRERRHHRRPAPEHVPKHHHEKTVRDSDEAAKRAATRRKEKQR